MLQNYGKKTRPDHSRSLLTSCTVLVSLHAVASCLFLASYEHMILVVFPKKPFTHCQNRNIRKPWLWRGFGVMDVKDIMGPPIFYKRFLSKAFKAPGSKARRRRSGSMWFGMPRKPWPIWIHLVRWFTSDLRVIFRSYVRLLLHATGPSISQYMNYINSDYIYVVLVLVMLCRIVSLLGTTLLVIAVLFEGGEPSKH